MSASPAVPTAQGSGANNSNNPQNCVDLGAQSIASNVDAGLLTALENSLWIILGSATLGTLLLCGAMYVMSRKRNLS